MELATTRLLWLIKDMSAQEIAEQLAALPLADRAEVLRKALASFCPRNSKPVERLLRRLEHPDIPDEVWRGIEEAEDGQLLDLDDALVELDGP